MFADRQRFINQLVNILRKAERANDTGKKLYVANEVRKLSIREQEYFEDYYYQVVV